MSYQPEIPFCDGLLVPQPVEKVFYTQMKRATPARIGVWRSGTRPLTQTLLKFRADHALAQDSVMGEVCEELVQSLNLLSLQTQVESKEQYLARPDLGRKISPGSQILLAQQGTYKSEVQIVVSDGLSSKAVEANIRDLLPALIQGLSQYNLQIGVPLYIKYGRVACMDEIGNILQPESLILLVGERPGLYTAESLSAYMAYRPHLNMLESERTVVSNIHRAGIPPVEAGGHLAGLMQQILCTKQCGVNS